MVLTKDTASTVNFEEICRILSVELCKVFGSGSRVVVGYTVCFTRCAAQIWIYCKFIAGRDSHTAESCVRYL